MMRGLREFCHVHLKVPRIRVRPDDCFLISWPRSGNTWLSHMLIDAMDEQGLGGAGPKWLTGLGRSLRHDFVRRSSTTSRRVFKSHDRFAPFYLRGRVVYLVRHGLDATVSYHHYRTAMGGKTRDWKTFLDRCLADRVRHGGWHRHVETWLEHRADPAMLVVQYEKMVENPGHELARVLDHYQVTVPADRIPRAVERASLEAVHGSFQQRARDHGKAFSGGLGGGTGRWRERFTEDDRQRFMLRSGRAMALLGYTATADDLMRHVA
jgi:estrone sulfotransferase